MKATQVGMLRGLLAPLENSYEVIVLDTPPSESYLTVNALAAADEVIIPLQAHYLALQGLAQALTQVDQVRNGLNPQLKVAGILPCRLISPPLRCTDSQLWVPSQLLSHLRTHQVVACRNSSLTLFRHSTLDGLRRL
jgi:hypothetical protein